MNQILCSGRWSLSLRLITISLFHCRWKGSIYKTIWKDLLVYYALYYLLTILHKYVLDDDGKK
jgi:hypothetical protein